jgi:hypothetical protein
VLDLGFAEHGCKARHEHGTHNIELMNRIFLNPRRQDRRKRSARRRDVT